MKSFLANENYNNSEELLVIGVSIVNSYIKDSALKKITIGGTLVTSIRPLHPSKHKKNYAWMPY